MRDLTRRLVIGSIALCLSCGAAMARQGTLATRDGHNYEGDITEKETVVTINIHGIETTISRDDIVGPIQYSTPIQQQYQDRLAKLPKDSDAPGHLELSRWLFDNHQYDLARIELNTALSIDPHNAAAGDFAKILESQIHLEQMHPAVPPNPLGPSTTTPPRPGPGDRRYLTADDVNIIRQMEWARKDASVKVRFDNDVRKHYLQFSNEVEKEFNLLAPTDQALRILEHRDLPEGLRKDVRILTDPAPLLEYRRSIQPMVQAGCATSNCHGGSSAGKFFLYPSVENDQATLTNFYLLNQYRQTIDGVERRVIDRTYPDKSLLEQYALPADQAEFRHPEVPKGTPWRGIPGPFKNKTEAGYKRVSDWMGSLIPQQPEYGITFTADRPPQAVEPSHTRPGAAPEKP